MTQIAKLFARVLNDGYRPKFAEFEKLVAAAGFMKQSQKGSHRSYRHPVVPRILTIQPNGNMAQDYQIKEFAAIVQQYNLWNGK